MNKYSIKLSGRNADDASALATLGILSGNTRNSILQELYKIPFELRVVVLTDIQVKQFNQAVTDGRINKHIKLLPVNQYQTIDLTRHEENIQKPSIRMKKNNGGIVDYMFDTAFDTPTGI